MSETRHTDEHKGKDAIPGCGDGAYEEGQLREPRRWRRTIRRRADRAAAVRGRRADGKARPEAHGRGKGRREPHGWGMEVKGRLKAAARTREGTEMASCCNTRETILPRRGKGSAEQNFARGREIASRRGWLSLDSGFHGIDGFAFWKTGYITCWRPVFVKKI